MYLIGFQSAFQLGRPCADGGRAEPDQRRSAVGGVALKITPQPADFVGNRQRIARSGEMIGADAAIAVPD